MWAFRSSMRVLALESSFCRRDISAVWGFGDVDAVG
jgi:hypothetical protein